MSNLSHLGCLSYRAALHRTYSDLSGTSQAYSAADELADGGPFTSLRVVLDSQLSGKTSMQAQERTVAR